MSWSWEELLKTAKHPKVQKLLEKALDDARVKPPSSEPTVVKPEVKPASKGPPDTAGMIKITNYGESVVITVSTFKYVKNSCFVGITGCVGSSYLKFPLFCTHTYPSLGLSPL